MLGTVDAVIKALGGPAEAAKLAGVGVTAVSNWKARGGIPPDHFLSFSSRLGDRIDPRVFRFRTAEERA